MQTWDFNQINVRNPSKLQFFGGCLLGGVFVPSVYSSHARWSYRRRLRSPLCAGSMCGVHCSSAITSHCLRILQFFYLCPTAPPAPPPPPPPPLTRFMCEKHAMNMKLKLMKCPFETTVLVKTTCTSYWVSIAEHSYNTMLGSVHACSDHACSDHACNDNFSVTSAVKPPSC